MFDGPSQGQRYFFAPFSLELVTLKAQKRRPVHCDGFFSEMEAFTKARAAACMEQSISGRSSPERSRTIPRDFRSIPADVSFTVAPLFDTLQLPVR